MWPVKNEKDITGHIITGQTQMEADPSFLSRDRARKGKTPGDYKSNSDKIIKFHYDKQDFHLGQICWQGPQLSWGGVSCFFGIELGVNHWKEANSNDFWNNIWLSLIPITLIQATTTTVRNKVCRRWVIPQSAGFWVKRGSFPNTTLKYTGCVSLPEDIINI